MQKEGEVCDVAIIGAGPTGLAAAVYTGREDLKTIVLDKGVVGGLIATTEHVDNYPGFPEGVGGLELASLMERHAKRFGADVRTGVAVRSLDQTQEGVVLETSGGSITARSVLVATGSNYRKLDVPGERELEGRGVHYCATCDGPLYRGKHVVAVGGGNTALQEGLFLSKFVDKLTVLVRGAAFKGSEVLIDALLAKPNVEVRFETVVTKIEEAQKRLSGVTVTSGCRESFIAADGMFVFIGLLPNSDWLPEEVSRDERGFVIVDREFGTAMEGVFAAGDIVAGSVGQVASAVGEGVSAALAIRRHLDPHHQAPNYASQQA